MKFLLVLIFATFCFGEIQFKQPQLSSFNAFKLNEVAIPFVLPIDWASNYYLRFSFSQALHNDINSAKVLATNLYSSPQLKFFWSEFTASTCLPSSLVKNPVDYGTISSSSPIYYLSLKSLNSKANSTIAIWIQILDKGIQSSMANKIQAFKLEIVTSTSLNPLVLETSQYASFFPLNDELKSASVQLFIQENAALAKYINYEHLVFIDLKLTKEMINSFKILVELDDDSFKFTNTCSLKPHNSSIIVIPNNLYTCKVDDVKKNQIWLEITKNQFLSYPLSLRIQAFVQNPPRVVEKLGISVFSMWNNGKRIIEYGQDANALSTSQMELDYYKLLVSNIDLSTANLPFPLKIIRASGSYTPFNSLRFIFKLKSGVIKFVDTLRISMKIAVNDATILEGSIQSNFSSSGICSYDSISKIIYCESSNISTAKEYYVGFRISLSNDIGENPIDLSKSFLLSIEYKDSTSGTIYTTSPIVSNAKVTNYATLETANSKDFQPSGAAYKKVVVSSQSLSGSLQNPGDSALNQIGNDQRLVFNLKAAYSEFTSASSNANTAIPDKAGFYILLPKQFTTSSVSGFKYVYPNGPSVVSVATTFSSGGNNEINKYTLITVSADNSDVLLKLFATTAADKYFGFENIKIEKECSVRVDDGNLCDIMVIAVDNIGKLPYQQTVKSYFLINSFSQDTTAFSNVKMAISNVYFTSSEGNTGAKVPVMMRVSGDFSSSEKINNVQFLVFFSFVNPIVKSGNEVYCSHKSNSTCQQYSNALSSSSQILQLPRIEIKANLTSPFLTLALPMTNLASSSSPIEVFAYVAILKNNTSTGFYDMFKLSQRYSFSFQTQASPISGPSYAIVGTGKKVGEISAASIPISFSSGSMPAYSTGNPNSGFSCVYNYEFKGSNTTTISSSMASSTDPCFNFDYKISSNHYYGLFCPYVSSLSGISITDFRYSSISGKVNNGWCSFSFLNGFQVANSLIQDNSIIQNANDLTSHTVEPQTFVPGSDFQYVKTSFETKFIIYCPFQVSISFDVSAAPSYSQYSKCSFILPNGDELSCSIKSSPQPNFVLEIQSCGAVSYLDSGKYSVIATNLKLSSKNATIDVKTAIYSPSTSNAYNLLAESTASKMTVSTTAISQDIVLEMKTSTQSLNIKQTVEFKFTINKPIYLGDAIEIFHNFAVNSMNKEKSCQLIDSVNKTSNLANEFAETFNSFKIIFKSTSTASSSILILRCLNYIPTNSDINGYYRVADSLQSTSINGKISNLSSPYNIDSSLFKVQKSISTGFGHPLYFELEFPVLTENIPKIKRIRIILPLHYKIGWLWCEINSIKSVCYKNSESSIDVLVPSCSISSEKIIMKIQGPSSNFLSITGAKFQILIDEDLDNKLFLETGDFPDFMSTLEAEKISKANILSSNFSSFNLLDSINTTLQISFDNKINKESFIYINIDPVIFGNGIISQNPNCQLLYKNVQISSKCEILGTMLNISLLTSIKINEVIELKINDLVAPDFTNCHSSYFSIIVESKSGNNYVISSLSYLTTAVSEIVSFSKPSGTEELTFSSSIFNVPLGVFSNQFQVKPVVGNFKKDFYLTSSSDSCKIKPNPLYISVNSSMANLSVGCFSNNTNERVLLRILKFQDGGIYSNLPYVTLNKDNNLPVLNLPSSITIPANALLYFLKVSLPNIPLESIDLYLTFNSSYLKNGNISINFHKSSSEGYMKILFVSGEKTGEFSGNYSISGIFQLPNTKLNIKFNNASQPTLTLSSGIIGNTTQNSVNFWSQANQMGLLFYRLFSPFCDSQKNSSLIFENSISSSRVDTGFCNEVYGSISTEALSNKTFSVDKIWAKTNYTTEIFFIDTQGTISNSSKFLFLTQSNNASVFKINFSFASFIAKSDEERLICFLSGYFRINGRLLRSKNDSSCPYSSTRRLQSNNSNSTNTTNSTNSSNSTNSTNTSSNANLTTNNTNSTIYYSEIFVSPNLQSAQDNTFNLVTQELNTSSNLEKYVKGNITGLPTLLGITANKNISSNPCTLSNEVIFKVKSISIDIENIKVSSSCFLYYGIYENQTVPSTPIEIRKGKNAFRNGRKFIETSGNVTIIGLKSKTKYNVILIGSSEIPGIETDYGNNITKSVQTNSESSSLSWKIKTIGNIIIYIIIILFL